MSGIWKFFLSQLKIVYLQLRRATSCLLLLKVPKLDSVDVMYSNNKLVASSFYENEYINRAGTWIFVAKF